MGRIASGRTFASLTVLVLTALAVPAAAQAGRPEAFPTYGGVPIACSDNTSYAMDGYYSSNQGYQFEVGSSGYIITGWQYLAATGGGTVAMQVLSDQTIGSDVFAVVAETAAEAPAPSTLNEYTAHIQLGPGRYALAIKAISGSPQCLSSGFPYDGAIQKSPAPAVGSGSTLWGSPQPGVRINAMMVTENDEDQDGFGDSTEDGCPGNTQRHDDCVKPDLPQLSTKTRKRKITISFTSEEPGTFQCHLENKKFSPCSSPTKLKKLKPGLHNFTVRAVDTNGNVGPQTSYRWRVKEPGANR